jgi:hypothetical protein
MGLLRLALILAYLTLRAQQYRGHNRLHTSCRHSSSMKAWTGRTRGHELASASCHELYQMPSRVCAACSSSGAERPTHMQPHSRIRYKHITSIGLLHGSEASPWGTCRLHRWLQACQCFILAAMKC